MALTFQVPPRYNKEFTIYAYFMDSSGTILSNPTIAAGDIKVQKNGGAAANLATTPTVANGLVPIVLSATEMQAFIVNVIAHDAAGDEWIDQGWTISIAGQTNWQELETSMASIEGSVDNIASRVTSTGVVVGEASISQIAAGINYSVVAIAPDGALDGGKITIRAYDSFTVPLVVGSISDRDELYFTVKSAVTAADTAAAIHISEGTGLEYIAGAAALTAANGDIAVSNASTGAVTVTLDEVETAKLTAGNYVYGVKKITTGGDAVTLMEGVAEVVTAVVREVA